MHRLNKQRYWRIASSSARHISSTFRGDSITDPICGDGRYAYCSQSSSDQCTGNSTNVPPSTSSR